MLACLFFLMILQSVAGIGILVVGTPLLLINYSLPEILSILLPISIITSFGNLIFFQKTKLNLKIKIDKKIKYYFFLICVPSIFFGLLILKKFENYFNFNLIVSIIIFLSLSIKILFHKYSLKVSNNYQKILLCITGVVHGLTNSGGSLLSLFINLKNENNISQYRYNIAFFYFFLALIQCFMFLYLFEIKIITKNLVIISFLLPVAIYLGNLISKKIKEKLYSNIINTLAFFASLLLFINNFTK